MAKNLKKTDHCLNCNYHFQNDKETDYCPRCGQKNIDNRRSLGFLFKDALANFFSLESKVLQTIFYLFTQPGVLTKFFNNGKRVRFITPIRLFIVLSALSFLTLSLLPENYSTLFNTDEVNVSEEEKIDAVDDISEKFDDLVDDMNGQDTIKVTEKNGMISLPKIITDAGDGKVKSAAIEAAVKEGRLYELADSLQIPTYTKQHIFVQFCKFRFLIGNKEGRTSISNTFLKYLPLGILFMMPFVAIFLKILFWRKGYYVEHLVHSLHLHSLFFGINALNDLFIIVFKIGLGTGILILIYLLYTWQSLKVVYKLSYVRGFFNLILLFVFDLLLFLFTFFISIFLTFLLI